MTRIDSSAYSEKVKSRMLWVSAVVSILTLVASVFFSLGPGILLALLWQGRHIKIEPHHYAVGLGFSDRQLAFASVWISAIIGLGLYGVSVFTAVIVFRSRMRRLGTFLLMLIAAVFIVAISGADKPLYRW